MSGCSSDISTKTNKSNFPTSWFRWKSWQMLFNERFSFMLTARANDEHIDASPAKVGRLFSHRWDRWTSLFRNAFSRTWADRQSIFGSQHRNIWMPYRMLSTKFSTNDCYRIKVTNYDKLLLTNYASWFWTLDRVCLEEYFVGRKWSKRCLHKSSKRECFQYEDMQSRHLIWSAWTFG